MSDQGVQSMSAESNYEKLKEYLTIKYNYLAQLGRFNLGEREGLESEYQWRLISDIMEYVDKIDQLDYLIDTVKTKKTSDFTVINGNLNNDQG